MNQDVIFVGPMKTGTTWIYNYLCLHESVNLPSAVKETFFFDRNYHKGLSWYSSHWVLHKQTTQMTSIEVAPSYFANSLVPNRIFKSFGDIPIVITLRDPVKRAWSHYLHLRRYGYTSESLEEACDIYPQLLESSRYNKYLRNWQTVFSESNINVLWHESMINDMNDYALNICNILDVPYISLSEDMKIKKNEAAVAPFQLLASTGRKLSYWLKDRRLYGPVNLAKKLGLRNIFFGRPGAQPLPEMSEKERTWLVNQLKPDYDQLPERYRHPSVNL